MVFISSVLIFLLTIVVAVYWYLTRNFNYWKIRNIPYKKPLPFFGNILDIILGNNSVGQYIAKLYNEFDGPYFGFFAMDLPFLVIKDPELIKRIMVQDYQTFPNRIFYNNEKIDPIVSNALFGLKFQQWKPLRAKLSPLFTTGKVKVTMPLMTECAHNMVQYLKTRINEIVETKDVAAKFTIDIIASYAFGMSVNSFADHNDKFIAAARKLFKQTFFRTIQPLSYIFAHKLVWLFRLQFFEPEAVKFLRQVFNEAIQERETTCLKRNDLIDIIIEIKNEEAKQCATKFCSDRHLSQAIMFFYAGHETASSTITFTLYELAMNPNIQTKLRKEIKQAIQDNNGITYDAIQNLKYLHMVVSETLRKYPLTPFLQRECVQDYLIPETGLVIERGSYVLIPQHGLHSDPQYFPEPQNYNPERFSDENKSKINSYCYLPFGTGPRNCIGERFGLLNAKLGVFCIINSFIVEPNLATVNPLVFGRAFLLQAIGGVPLTYKLIEN